MLEDRISPFFHLFPIGKDSLPAGAALVSPWCDLSESALSAESMTLNAKRDMVSPNAIRLLARAVGGTRRLDPRVSAIYHFKQGGGTDEQKVRWIMCIRRDCVGEVHDIDSSR